MSDPGTTEELLQFLYLMPVAVVKFRADGSINLINPMAAQLLMPMARDARLDNFYKVMDRLVPDLRQHVARFEEKAGTIIDQQRLEADAGGRTSVLCLTVSRITHDVYMGVLKDVTKLAEQERKLFSDHQKFRAIFDHVRDYAIYTITTEGIVEEWNQSLARFAGWQAKDVDGQSLAMFFPPDDPHHLRIDALLSEAQRIGSVETEGWRLKRDGGRLWGNTVITALPDEDGSVRGFVVVARDMTERKRMEDDLKQLATTDSLTGAYNRRYGRERLLTEYSRRERNGRMFAVLMLDIDHFKSINDRFGHAAGDSVLCALVEVCQRELRAVDTLARWGGEEFLMVLADTDAPAAIVVAERLRTAAAGLRVASPGVAPISFTVSIGVATPTDKDPTELLRRADAALYAAKSGNRNQVVLAR